MNFLTDIVPAQYRKAFYGLFTLAGIVLGALQIATSGDWLDVTTKVYAYLGTALGLTAFSNTNPPEDTPPPGD